MSSNGPGLVRQLVNLPRYERLEQIPSVTDQVITEFIAAYRQGSQEDRGLASGVSADGIDRGSTLRCYADRMASLAAESGESTPVTHGLTALGLGAWQEDWRDSLGPGTALIHAASKTSQTARSIVEDVMPLLSPEAASLTAALLDRASLPGALGSVGWHLTLVLGQMRYVPEYWNPEVRGTSPTASDI